MIIHKTNKKTWSPRHETFELSIENLYNLANEDTGNVVADYNDTTKGIQKLLLETIQNNLRLRVVGGEWSFTKITATDGIILNTKPLNLSMKITAGSVHTNYANTADDLYFAQCGVSVQELNNRLRNRGRSLKTSGASNGQTIVGALSTGTHGSAFKIGAFPEFVVGLHIIVSPTRHVWLERESYPVVSDSFVQKIKAERVSDDKLFKAALVSFGSFGFIHGVMIETVPLFLYEAYRQRMLLDATLEHSMNTLDFNNLALPNPTEEPYHFQVVIDPYDLDNGVYVTTLYKRDYTDMYTRPALSPPGVAPGDDAPTFIGKLTQVAPRLVPKVVTTITKQQYPPFEKVIGTHGEIFFSTAFHGKVLSAAVGVPLDRTLDVLHLLLDLNQTAGPFTGVFACRYVKGTDATLGFTKFPITCVVELDGVFSKKTVKFCDALWDALEVANIPFAFHWGKLLTLNKTRLKKMYTQERINNWVDARHSLIQDPDALKLFTNEVMTEWGLDG